MVMKKLKTRKLICICSGIILLILAGAFIYYKHHMGRMISSVYHPVSFVGEVIEEINETTVVMEVTENWSSPYQVNEQVMVEYERGKVRTSLWKDETEREHWAEKMEMGERYIINFWEQDIKKQNGRDMVSLVGGASPIFYDDDDMEVKATYVVTGKIVKKDTQSVVLEVTKERGGYHVGDKLTVKYDRAILMDAQTMKEKEIIKEIEEGEEYSFQMDNADKEKDGCIKIKDLVKYE